MSKNSTIICRFQDEECSRSAWARGLCGKHYKQCSKTSDLDKYPPLPKDEIPLQTCLFTGEKCHRPVKARSLCDKHHQQWWRAGHSGDPLIPETWGNEFTHCRYEDKDGHCPLPASTKGYCGKHYGRILKHGDPSYNSRPTLDMTIEERLHFYLDKDGSLILGHEELGPCWLWTAGSNRKGYGLLKGDRSQLAHVTAYELLVGSVPAGRVLDHLCHTYALNCKGGNSCPHRLCCNPSHLEPVTESENIKRRRVHTQPPRTHCIHGHELTEENTYVSPQGNHQCRTCRAYQSKNRALKSRGLPPLPPMMLTEGPVNALRLANRDNWICGICNHLINKSLSYPDPGYRSIDHIILVSDGGPDVYENARIAHLDCNKRRQRG